MRKILLIFLTTFTLTLLIACTTEVVSYEVTFYVDDEENEVVLVEKGETLDELPTITKQDYEFLGWFIDKELNKELKLSTIINENLSAHAIFKEIETYLNPVYKERFVADPHIIRHENKFYIYSTGGHILESSDMYNWTDKGNIGISPTWGTNNAGLWAPDIVKVKDKFIIYYSLSTWGDSNPGIGIASADHPLGPWTDHGKLFRSKEIGVENSIDAAVFVDTDERVYLFWGSFQGLYAVELTSDGMNLLNGIEYARENKVHIAGNSAESQIPHDNRTYEAPYIIKKDGFYYLFLSTGDCCPQDRFASSYNVVVGRSDQVLGEYKDHLERSMRGPNRGSQVVKGFLDFVGRSSIGTGHNSIIVDDNNNFWIYYHAYFSEDGLTISDRVLAMDMLLWNDEGWPYLEDYYGSVVRKEVPYLKYA